MSNKTHFEILQRTVATAPNQIQAHEWTHWYEKTEWFLWREANPCTKPDLSGADLRNMVLVAIDLSFAMLSGANLTGSSLSNLEGADLSNATMSGVDLIEALLNGADLTDADLTRATLEGASLHNANLTGTNFSFADLSSAELWGASMEGANFTGANLFETEFSDDIGAEELAEMNAPRTSESSPLKIAEIEVGTNGGFIGLTICPGKKDADRRWRRDLEIDLEEIKEWGATTVVTLIEDHEFRMLDIEAIEAEVHRSDMAWMHLPIVDVSVPDHRFESAWHKQGKEIHRRLDAGERILIHCRGGLGRTGLVAGLILVEHGAQPKNAIQLVRSARPHAIETHNQRSLVQI